MFFGGKSRHFRDGFHSTKMSVFHVLLKTIVCVFCCFEIVCGQEIQEEVDPELLLGIDEILIKHGYPVEKHDVTTQDGYIITLFRIPHGKGGSGVNKKPILMMHGLFGSPVNYVFTEYYNKSMAGYFADRGYDVWLGNTRGGTYARKHVKLDPNKTKFWKFSWHDIGLYDLSAMVDFILEKTKKKQLYYIGHSQGGTIFYVLNSLRPEYQKKFAQASLLAPGGFMKHFNNSLLIPLAKNHKMLFRMAENAKLYELPPPWINLSDLLLKTCIGTMMQTFCEAAYNFMNGGDSGSFEQVKKMFPMLLGTLPTASTMQCIHYAQNIDAAKFRQWDFGKKKNMEVYGAAEPPEYPVQKIDVPVAIYYGKNDNLAWWGDQEDMCRALNNCTRLYLMPNLKWNHLDFVLSMNSDDLNKPVLEYMNTFDSK